MTGVSWNEEGLGDKEKVWAALQRFQEMRESGEFCCLEIYSDYAYVWEINYAWAETPSATPHQRRGVPGGAWPTLDSAIENAYTLWKRGDLPRPGD